MSIQQEAKLLRGGAVQLRALALQLLQLPVRLRERIGETRELRFDRILGDVVFRNLHGADLDDMRLADRDAGGDAEAAQDQLAVMRAFASAGFAPLAFGRLASAPGLRCARFEVLGLPLIPHRTSDG
jgi:hypothetical protein